MPAMPVGTSGEFAAIRFELGAATNIGRDPSCDLAIASVLLARRHARITFVTDRFELEDLGSTSGCYVNGLHLRGAIPLTHGDELRIGGLAFRFALS